MNQVLNSVAPVFMKCSETGDVTQLQICDVVTRVIGKGKLDGVQRIGNLWRIYPTEKAARIELFMTKTLQVEGKAVTLYDQNPYAVGLGYTDMTAQQTPQQKDKLTIKNIPLSVSNSEIESLLKGQGVKFSSPLRYGHIRNEQGQLTNYKSGDRYLYVEPFNPPLPVRQKVGDFSSLAFHHGKQAECKACGTRGHRVGEDMCPAKPKRDEDTVTFRGYRNPLNNHFPFELSAYDTTFASVEHAFFWRMSSEMNKPQLAEKIKKAKHAGIAKQLSKEIALDNERLQWEMNSYDVMKYLIQQKFQQCTQFRAWLLENIGKTLAEATGSRLWGTGMSPFLSENTAPDYWPGKNLLGSMLTELTCELTDDPMNEGEREDSEEEDHNKDDSEGDEDEDEYEEYEDAQQEGIDTQSQNSCPPAPTSAQNQLTIQNSDTTNTAQAENMPKKTVSNRSEPRTKTPGKGKGRRLKQSLTSISRKPYSKPSTVITPAKNLDIRKAFQHVGAGAKRKPSGSPGDKDLDSVHLIKRPSEEHKDGT